jgi:hypothetical protein
MGNYHFQLFEKLPCYHAGPSIYTMPPCHMRVPPCFSSSCQPAKNPKTSRRRRSFLPPSTSSRFHHAPMAPRSCTIPHVPPHGGHMLMASSLHSPSLSVRHGGGLCDIGASGGRPGGASASLLVGGRGGGGGTRGSPRRLSLVASLDAVERVQADACSSQQY